MGSILVVNAGSTSLKLSVVDEGSSTTRLASLAEVGSQSIAGVAHRVVHGGSRFREPVLIDDEVLHEIDALSTLAPLHNTPALAGIGQARAAFPHLRHVAVFDTSFHQTMPPEATVYALPRIWREEWGIRRFGFHGLSVEWSVERAAMLLKRSAEELRLVVCHLGGGCSVTAVRERRSVDTTMGFSPLEGIPMSTRSGSIDPGALLYALRERGLRVDQVDHALNFESGIEGLAPELNGMREIEAAAIEGDDVAGLALDVFVHRLAGAIAAMAASAGGLNAVVFTAGIGENSAVIRERTCRRLTFLGLTLDHLRNADAERDSDVASDESDVRALVIHAREELVAARAARTLLT